MIKVNITALYNLIVNKELIPTSTLALEAKTLYKALKLEGGNHVNVYYNINGNRIYEKVSDSDLRIRAMAVLVLRIMYRWNDRDTRLEHHFELPTAVSSILDMKQLTKSAKENGNDYSYITVRMLIENYTGKKFSHSVEEW